MAPALAFTDGWVRLPLHPCPGVPVDAPAGQLEVEGADRVLAFSPGRPGGATLGVLADGGDAAPAARQTFALPLTSTRAREVVLAPWSGPGEPPRLRRLQLLARAAPSGG